MKAEAEIRKLLTELYKLVSGPAGFKRDWKRLTTLLTPYAKMIRTSLDIHGQPQALVMDVQSYPRNFEKLMAGQAFYEYETHHIIESFGNIAHAFSTYEAWADCEKTHFLKRGINSIQLYFDGCSWKIINMIWDDERPRLAIPTKYNPDHSTDTE